MSSDNLQALVRSRLEQADDALNAARILDREFVRPGVFSRDLSQWLHRAFRQRLAVDYAPLRTVSKDEAQQMFDEAQAFVARLREHLARELHP